MVLVIEENPVFSSMYRKALNRCGKEAVFASGRRAGLYLLIRRNPAIIFIEIKINGQSEEGLLFIKEALRERPDLVLIAVSSEDESKVIDRTLNLGAIDFLVKITIPCASSF